MDNFVAPLPLGLSPAPASHMPAVQMTIRVFGKMNIYLVF